MRKVHDERLKMFAAVSELLRRTEITIATIPALHTAFHQLEEKVLALFTLKRQQELNRTGYASDKRSKRSGLAELAMQACGKVKAYAKLAQNEVLLHKMHITISQMKSGKSTTALTLAQSIYKAAQELPASAKTNYSITPALLQQLQESIDQYATVITAPRMAQVQCTVQTQLIDETVRATTALLRQEIDGLMLAFRDSTFYQDYLHARRITKEATHQASIIGKITDEKGLPATGALVQLSNSTATFEEMTNEKGKYKIRNLHAEIYQLKITRPGYQEYILNDVGFYAGEHERVDVQLRVIAANE